jgi:hypothetical protein
MHRSTNDLRTALNCLVSSTCTQGRAMAR